MPLNLNNNEVTGVDLNNTEVSEVRLNGQTVFGAASQLQLYTLTDPDGKITINSPTSFDADFTNGINEVARLFINEPLIDSTVSFDIEVSNYSNFASYFFGYADTGNAVMDDNPSNAGFRLRNPNQGGDFEFVIGIAGSNIICQGSLNTTYSVTVDYNASSSDFNVDISGSDFSGNETESLPAASMTHHYAVMGGGESFNNEGNAPFEVTNFNFDAI